MAWVVNLFTLPSRHYYRLAVRGTQPWWRWVISPCRGREHKATQSCPHAVPRGPPCIRQSKQNKAWHTAHSALAQLKSIEITVLLCEGLFPQQHFIVWAISLLPVCITLSLISKTDIQTSECSRHSLLHIYECISFPTSKWNVRVKKKKKKLKLSN